MDNYSEFAREAMIEKLEREGNSAWLELQAKTHEAKAREYRERMKAPPVPFHDPNKYKEILTEAVALYKATPLLQHDHTILWHRIKDSFYSRLKLLPEGKGAAQDVIRKFINDIEEAVQ